MVQGLTPDSQNLASSKGFYLLFPASSHPGPRDDDEGSAGEVCGLVQARESLVARKALGRSPAALAVPAGARAAMIGPARPQLGRPRRNAIARIDDPIDLLCRLTC
jgi:hypothetical protein